MFWEVVCEDGSGIRELRTRRGLLQRELAEMAGATESAVRNYELGLRTPRHSTWKRLLAPWR